MEAFIQQISGSTDQSNESNLSNEVAKCLWHIAPFLEGRDIKELRLTCKFMLLKSVHRSVCRNILVVADADDRALDLRRLSHLENFRLNISYCSSVDLSGLTLDYLELHEVKSFIPPRKCPREVVLYRVNAQGIVNMLQAGTDDLMRLTIRYPRGDVPTFDLSALTLDFLELTGRFPFFPPLKCPRELELNFLNAEVIVDLLQAGTDDLKRLAIRRPRGDAPTFDLSAFTLDSLDLRGVESFIPPMKCPRELVLYEVDVQTIVDLLQGGTEDLKRLAIREPTGNAPTFDLSGLTLDYLELYEVESFIPPEKSSRYIEFLMTQEMFL